MELTLDQQRILASGGNVRVNVDGLDCVVLKSEIFDRVARLLAVDWSDAEMRALLAQSWDANGWDDPAMSIYDEIP